MKSILLVFLSLVFCCFYGFSQISQLQPVDGVFSTNTSKGAYHTHLKNMILSDLPKSIHSRVVVTSTSQPEYVLSIDKKNDRYMLTYVGLKQNIGRHWLDMEELQLSYYTKSVHKVELSYQLAGKLNELLRAATSNARYPTTPKNFRDTVRYTFITSVEPGYRSGSTSLFNIDEKLTELVEITNWLRYCAINERVTEAEPTIKRIERLTKRFK